MRPLVRSAPTAAALAAAAMLLVAGGAYAYSSTRGPTLWGLESGTCPPQGYSCVEPPEVLLFLALAASGAAGAVGILSRRPRALVAGAGVFAAYWIVASVAGLATAYERWPSAVAGTVRQHGAILVLVAAAYGAAAWAAGWRPRGTARMAIAGAAALLALVSLAAFTVGAPGRDTPGSPAPLLLGALALGALLLARHARAPRSAPLPGALVMAAGLEGAWRHLAHDPEPLVALVSYAAPGLLALAPAALLLSLRAWRAPKVRPPTDASAPAG
jgi:hypothetical protein